MKRGENMNTSIFLKKTAYKVSEQAANQVCPFLFHQPSLPKKVKELKK